MDRRKWVLTIEEGQNVQVKKVNQSLELYLDDTHQPTHWIIRKQKKRLVLFYEYEGSLYVLTFVKDSRKEDVSSSGSRSLKREEKTVQRKKKMQFGEKLCFFRVLPESL
ncbi:uncharacterized protein LOC144994634 [Oryzias latipes]